MLFVAKITNALLKIHFTVIAARKEQQGLGDFQLGAIERLLLREMGSLSAPKPQRHWRGTKTAGVTSSDPGCSAKILSRKA